MSRFTLIDAFGRPTTDRGFKWPAVYDQDTNLMWMSGCSSVAVRHEDAGRVCSEINILGYRDWRLPKLAELQTLIDYGCCSPAIDTCAFRDCHSEPFWAAEPVAGSANYFWTVDFKWGETKAIPHDIGAYVRPCRWVQEVI